MTKNIGELEAIARRIRVAAVRMSHDARAPHLGSSLSCVELLTALYWGAARLDPEKPDDPARDRVLLSKGHAASTLYAALACRGFFPETELASFGKPGSCLSEHPCPKGVPGLEAATGSLGHGLGLGLGMALAGRIQGISYRTFVVMSDGECNEGSVWEAAMMAPAHRLDNLTAIIDYNRWQATGRSDEVLALAPLGEKWKAFGWNVRETDGHDLGALLEILAAPPDGSGRPTAVVARTVKGKGVSFMEDDNNWHYRVPNDEELGAALRELGQP